MSKLTRSDWLLLVAAASEHPLQPVQLQKSLFLLGENLGAKGLHASRFYQFRPYDYGPFSSEIYQDAEALEAGGLLSIRRPPASRYRLYIATAEGRARAREIRSELGSVRPEAVSYLDTLVEFVTTLSFDELLRAVYTAYPKMKVNSVFRDTP